MFADSWDVERTTVLEHQCQPYTMPYLFHGPLQFRVWEERQPDYAGVPGDQVLHRHLPAVAHDLDGRPPAPARVRAPHVHGVLDRRMERRHPHRDHYPYQGGLLPPQRHPQQRSHHAGRALHPPRQRAVARDHRHRPGVSDRALHPQPGIRADGAQQHELALQLRIRQRDPAPSTPGADVPAGEEPVAGRGRCQVRDAAGGGSRRGGDDAARIRGDDSHRARRRARKACRCRQCRSRWRSPPTRGRAPCPPARCARCTCKGTCT